MYVYGVLAGPMENIDPINMIYYKKKLEGFLLSAGCWEEVCCAR